jgi:hypothetical protein
MKINMGLLAVLLLIGVAVFGSWFFLIAPLFFVELEITKKEKQ